MEYLAGILIHIFCYLNLSVIEDYLEKILIKNTYYVKQKIMVLICNKWI